MSSTRTTGWWVGRAGTKEPIELLEMGDEIAAALGRTGVDDELARDVVKRAQHGDLLGLSRPRHTQVRPHLCPCAGEIGMRQRLALVAIEPPANSLRQKRTVSSLTPNASAICGLVQPASVRSTAAPGRLHRDRVSRPVPQGRPVVHRLLRAEISRPCLRRHSALSYEHAGKVEAQLKAEVADLMAKAEAADAADIPDGMSIPDELARREERLRKLAEARAKIEARAKERHAREQAEHEVRLAARQAKAEASGEKPRGKPPEPPVEGPRPNDQINLTDEESRIMPVAGGGFDQCYNAQAAVAAGSLLVVASAVSQAPNDKQQLEPMLDKIEALADELGKPECLLSDYGLFQRGECRGWRKGGDRTADHHGEVTEPHHPPLAERFEAAPEAPQDPTPVEAMAHRLKTPAGRALYALRKQMPEPVFGIIKSALGFRQFLLRGPSRARAAIERRHHGLEHQADVRLRPCLAKAEVRRLGRQAQGNPDIRLLQSPSAPNPTRPTPQQPAKIIRGDQRNPQSDRLLDPTVVSPPPNQF